MAYFECRLEKYRQRKGLTRSELAHLVGTHRDTIGMMERELRIPSLKLVSAISREVGAPIEELFIFS